MFPIKNASGHVIAFGARVIGDGQPKYLNSPETELFLKRKTLYGFFEGMPSIKKEEKVLLLEGYMDVITSHQYGIGYAVSPLGTALSVEHLNFIKRYTKEPIIMFDPDESGKNALIRNRDVLIESGVYARAAELPENMDPDEFLHKYGRHGFEKVLNQSIDLMDFQIKIISNQFKQPMTPLDKSKAAQILLESIRKQPDEIIKREWIKNISIKFEIPQETILLQLKKGSAKSDTRISNLIKSEQVDIPPIEMGFIHLLLKNPELIKHARDISEEDFQSDFSKKMFSSINDLCKEDKNVLVTKLADMFPQEAHIIMKLAVEEIESTIPCQESIYGSVKLIKKFSKERRWKHLKEKISGLSKTELDEFNKLTLELKQ
jgi:DNA primase